MFKNNGDTMIEEEILKARLQFQASRIEDLEKERDNYLNRIDDLEIQIKSLNAMITADDALIEILRSEVKND